MATADLELSTIIEQTPYFKDQWYIQNTGQTGGTPGADLNIVDAWKTATGQGVTISIVHQGVDYEHPDFRDNYTSALSYDFVQNDSDPFPREEEEIRSVFAGTFGYPTATGTYFAGVIAAEGDNGRGIVGVAPDVTFASLRIEFEEETADFYSDTIAAISHQNQEIDIYNNSWRFSSFEELQPGILEGIKTNIQEGRGGLGNIYVFANSWDGLEDNINYHPVNNSRYTITVNGIDHNGEHPGYTSPGAALLISGYSHNDEAKIVTTDSRIIGSLLIVTRNNYLTDLTGGTGIATAQVSGVVALMLEANPNLNWRDVQHILLETAEKNDPEDEDWVQNGAGYDVNHKYGFGAVDATAAVNTALSWESVTDEVSVTSEAITIDTEIPDNDTDGISFSFEINEDIKVESVEVTFDADHNYRGDLSLVLTSPDGTRSVLAESREDDGDNYDNWLFTSVRHWGESSQGEWTLKVADETAENSGTWNSWQISLYGTANSEDTEDIEPMPEPEGNPPTVVAPIDDFSVTGNGEDRTIDLSSVFEDRDEDEITVTVASNSNDELVAATVEDNNLVLDFTEDTSGTAEITLRATANGQTVDDTFSITVNEEDTEQPPEEPEEPEEQTIELFRFRNTTFSTGTYIFVGEAERDFILDDDNLSNTFSLDGQAEDGTMNPAFTASSVDGEGLIPFYRLESTTVGGTFLFVSTAEYEFIFDDPVQSEQWKKQGFADEEETQDIPEFYLRDGSADGGTVFNRFQNQENGTFLYAGGGEIDTIKDNPDLANLFDNQGVAFKSM